jgi:ribosomal protein L5
LTDLHPDKSGPEIPGAVILWTANATDPEYDQVHYKFLLNGEPVTVWSKFNYWSWNTKGLTPGDYKITVLAKDGKHALGASFDSSMNATFALASPNSVPILQSLSATPASPQSKGTGITWLAGATDPDNDQISYRFFLNDKEATGWSSSNSWTWDTSSADPGDYKISVIAKDGKHATGDGFDSSKAAAFRLLPPAPAPLPNQIPILQGLKPSPASPQSSGTRITWTANATDPDNDKISYRFLLDGKEATDWSGSNSWTWNTESVAPGDYKVEVRIRDDKHASGDSFDDTGNATLTLLPPNRPPVLESLAPDKASPQNRGTTVFWKAKASDPDDDRVLYKFLLGGQPVSKWTKSNSWSWSTRDTPAGDYEIRVLIRDEKHADENSFDGSMNASFTLSSPNQVPVLQKLEADKASPQSRGAGITWTAQASDADGDPISYKFLLDDKDMTGWSTSGSWTWDTSSAAPGDHNIKAVVRDGKHGSEESYDGSKEAVFTLQASNQLPTLLSLQSDKSSPQTQGATISWKAEATDPEGDPIQYRFLQDGKAMTGWSESNSWSWATAGIPKEKYQIQVQIRDGKHAPESSFDRSMQQSLTLISEIDQQIEQLQKKRGSQASGKGSGQSLGTQVVTDNSTKERAVLGKGVPEQDTAKKPEPRRLG